MKDSTVVTLRQPGGFRRSANWKACARASSRLCRGGQRLDLRSHPGLPCERKLHKLEGSFA